MLNWLEANGISFEYSFDNLAKFALRGERDRGVHNVVFVYEYVVSHVTMLGIVPERNLVVVNLHNWNGGPFSQEAQSYAKEIGLKTMAQREFYVYCHKKVK